MIGDSGYKNFHFIFYELFWSSIVGSELMTLMKLKVRILVVIYAFGGRKLLYVFYQFFLYIIGGYVWSIVITSFPEQYFSLNKEAEQICTFHLNSITMFQ